MTASHKEMSFLLPLRASERPVRYVINNYNISSDPIEPKKNLVKKLANESAVAQMYQALQRIKNRRKSGEKACEKNSKKGEVLHDRFSKNACRILVTLTRRT